MVLKSKLLRWGLLPFLFILLLFQFTNLSTFMKTEIGVYGFKTLDSNSDGFIDRSEWNGLGFSVTDLDRNNIIDDEELRFLVEDFMNDFSWVNKASKRWDLPDQLVHSTFLSPSMNKEVGYYIYIPDSYHLDQDKKFRTVYYLHGGRPGNEGRSVVLSNTIQDLFSTTDIDPALYIFVNGGELSHYNYAENDSYGEDVFTNELIPHIDSKYRTIATSEGRGLEGFSQGGRGATRYMFRHLNLFSTVAAGGASYEIEKLIQKDQGYEDDPRGSNKDIYFVGKGNDAWSLAEKHVKYKKALPNFLIWVGSRDLNYPGVVDYKNYLDFLSIKHEFIVAEGVEHNPFIMYEEIGEKLVRFHAND